MANERAPANGIELAYETFGDRDAPPLVLVAGLGRQLIGWHDDLCRALADRGHLVVRFDNRDAGESTHLHDAGMPDLQAVLAGDTSTAPYSLDDMADDTAGLIDALDLDGAHLVGASLGGMVAQTVAVRHPERVRSLTSIMSTTGRRDLLRPTPEANAVLLQPAPRSREEAMERAVAAARVLGSPAFELDVEWVRGLSGRSWDRAHDPPGYARQLAAVHRSGDRTEALRSLALPTLVLHGEEDPLIPLAAGHGTAEAIDGAELVTYPGMGHDLPRALWPDFVDRISALVATAERERAAA